MFVRPPTDVSDVEGARLQTRIESLRERTASTGTPAARRVRGVESARELYENASTPEEKKIRETSDEFVSILYGMLFKQMESTVDRTGFLDGGKTEEMFRSFTLDEYAKKASSQNSNPLTHRVYEMLYEASAARRSMPASTTPAASTARPSAGLASPGVFGDAPSESRSPFSPIPAI
jgi:Rod binding domain-containing protein